MKSFEDETPSLIFIAAVQETINHSASTFPLLPTHLFLDIFQNKTEIEMGCIHPLPYMCHRNT